MGKKCVKFYTIPFYSSWKSSKILYGDTFWRARYTFCAHLNHIKGWFWAGGAYVVSFSINGWVALRPTGLMHVLGGWTRRYVAVSKLRTDGWRRMDGSGYSQALTSDELLIMRCVGARH